MTKDDEGRLVYLTPELKTLVAAQIERVRELERQTGRIIPHLFPHFRFPARGQRLENFRGLWPSAYRENPFSPAFLRPRDRSSLPVAAGATPPLR
jgi:hypothetical protein